MPISAGDIVLTVLTDITQGEAGLDAFRDKAAATASSATSAMGGMGLAAQATGKAAEDAGTSLADAWRLIPPVVQQSDDQLKEMGYALLGIAPVAEEVSERIKSSMRHGMAEVSEVGHQTFGIGLPRSLRAFLLELPGVAPAMEAAFSVLSVLLLLDIFVKLIEKAVEFSERAEKMAASWETVEGAFREGDDKIQQGLNDTREKIITLTQGAIPGMEFALKHMGDAGVAALAIVLKELEKLNKDLELNSGFLDTWLGIGTSGQSLKDVGEFSTKLQTEMRKAAQASPGDPTASLRKGIELTEEKIKGLNVSIGGIEHKDDPFFSEGTATEGIEKERTALLRLNEQFKNSIELQKEREKLGNDQIGEKRAELEKKRAEELFKIYKETFAARQAMEKDLEQQQNHNAKITDSRLKGELKDAEQASKEKLDLLKRQEEAAMAVVDGSIKQEELADENKAQLLKIQYDKGLISGKQYLEQLKALYQQEVKALTAMLTQKQQLVILEAQNEAARRGQILTTADAKELKAYIDLENKKRQLSLEFDNKLLKTEDQLDKKAAKMLSTRPQWDKYFQDLAKGALKTGEAFKELGKNITASIAQSVEAAIMGSEGFGQAMEQILKSALASLAGIAVVQVITEIAKAASDLATPGMEAHASLHFHAAEEWALVGAVAGIAGAAMPGGSGSSSGSSAGSSSGDSIDSSSSANHPAQQPVSTTNIAHLGNGGLVDTPMMAEIGHGREVVLPLDNESVMQAFREGIGANGPITVIVEGIPLHKLSRRMSSDQKKGKYRVHSTSSARTIRQY